MLVFYIIDSRYHAREANEEQIQQEEEVEEDLRIAGKWNFLLLAGVVGSVLLSGLWKPDHPGFEILGSHYALQNLVARCDFAGADHYFAADYAQAG